jgi:hypothetical protein
MDHVDVLEGVVREPRGDHESVIEHRGGFAKR